MRSIRTISSAAIENRIGNGFPDEHAGNLLHGIAPAFDVLDVDGRENVDPGGEQLEHVLVALGMTRAGRVAVRQLVNDGDLRMPKQNRVEIHFAKVRAAVFELRARHDRQSIEQSLGLRAPVRLDYAEHDFTAGFLRFPRRLQHGEGFAHARDTFRRRSSVVRVPPSRPRV